MGHGPGDRNRNTARNSLITFGSRNYRFRERLIRPAASLYALGWLHTVHSNPSDEYVSRQVEDLVKQWKLQPQRYLSDFDLDRNGKIQKGEWKVVRGRARQQVLARIRAQKREHHVLKRSPDSGLPYIISALDEDSLVARKKIKAYASVSIAFVLFSLLVILSAVRLPLPI